MTALHSLRSTHVRSALPTVNHTRTVLQKMRDAVERPMPPAAVVTLSPQATRSTQTDAQAYPSADPSEPTTRESWDAAETEGLAEPESTPPQERSPEVSRPQDKSSMDGLTEAGRQMVSELVQRDREVHAHEAAHQAAGGGLVGAASYSYQEGPDGRSYAIGGECPIQIPASSNPSEMIAVAERVRAAALAPANPSAQDLAVANAAVQMEAQARQTLAQQLQAQSVPSGLASAQAKREPAPGEVPTSESQPAIDAGTVNRAMTAYARTSMGF